MVSPLRLLDARVTALLSRAYYLLSSTSCRCRRIWAAFLDCQRAAELRGFQSRDVASAGERGGGDMRILSARRADGLRDYRPGIAADYLGMSLGEQLARHDDHYLSPHTAELHWRRFMAARGVPLSVAYHLGVAQVKYRETSAGRIPYRFNTMERFHI